MSESKPNNPQLVESIFPDGSGVESNITLRDLFAAFALAGMLVDPNANVPKQCATDAYTFADAMLAERERK